MFKIIKVEFELGITITANRILYILAFMDLPIQLIRKFQPTIAALDTSGFHFVFNELLTGGFLCQTERPHS